LAHSAPDAPWPLRHHRISTSVSSRSSRRCRLPMEPRPTNSAFNLSSTLLSASQSLSGHKKLTTKVQYTWLRRLDYTLLQSTKYLSILCPFPITCPFQAQNTGGPNPPLKPKIVLVRAGSSLHPLARQWGQLLLPSTE